MSFPLKKQDMKYFHAVVSVMRRGSEPLELGGTAHYTPYRFSMGLLNFFEHNSRCSVK